jgi:hypothetical protein
MPRRNSIKTLFPAAMLAAPIILFSLPSLAAPLSFDTDYYRPPAEGATRIPRSSNDGAFVQLSHVPSGGGITGSPHKVSLSAAPTMTINNLSYMLVSVTIAGGVEGVTQAYPDSGGNLPVPDYVPVWVGTSDIVVTYHYLPIGGNCATQPCPPGFGSSAVLDEASDLTGGLLDDVFVEGVFQPPTDPIANSGVTHNANYLGIVDTSGNDVKIVAYSDPHNPTTNKPTGSIFDRWVSPVSGLNLAPGGLDLKLNKGQGGYFLAYYRHSCPANYHFVPSPTLSACEPDDCKANQFWDAAKNQCETASCFPGETCGHYTCPKTCPRGCIVVPPETAFNKTSKPIFACKNASGGIGTPLPE